MSSQEAIMPGAAELWERYCAYLVTNDALGFSLDVSRVRFSEAYLDEMAPAMQDALTAMAELEAGSIANANEQRMVGHYWLRKPELAPDDATANTIRRTLDDIEAFTTQVHDGSITGKDGPFKHVLHIGIGGSALGPQFVSHALQSADDKLKLHFIDNTDPDGIDMVLAGLDGVLGQTLVTVVSKSGTTPEPSNGLLEAKAAYERAGVDFAPHAVAVTTDGSKLDDSARHEKWLQRFPMWDWVGGRTSVMSAVGLVPLALQGIDVRSLLAGAAAMDEWTRTVDIRQNPAALMALMWHKLGNGRGEKDMVILPYKDRLMLFSRYLQQLVMESLGKELDRSGAAVNQGLAVYGNKGSTDQHAYVQQLREGVLNFFVVFIEVLRDRAGESIEVTPGITAGDFLMGFLHGTRRALYENGRESITITLDEVTARSVGALIALFDRAVGLYAELINVNAYHQPGVEAGKKAAAAVIDLQQEVVSYLRDSDSALTAAAVADAIDRSEDVETVFKILRHLAGNPDRTITMRASDSPQAATFSG